MPDEQPQAGEGKSSKTPILIDLTRRRDPRRLDTKPEVIQLLALERLERVVASLMQEARSPEPVGRDELFLDRRHNAITLHGRRGSGKTTLLLHILKLIQTGTLYPSDRPDEVVMLGLIDPTLIESKENVFVSILALIKQKVDEHKQSRQTGKSADDAEAAERDYKRWQESLRKLATGLTLLDGVGRDNPMGEAWENPTYVLEKGLQNAKSGKQLERSFHEFIDRSLEFLDSAAFVLALDDIDTDFRHGWEILEVLRKYLTSRKLVIFLCGNLDLYSMLIRGEKWSLFKSSLMLKDRRRWHQYHDMVGELQSQYLQKILKPENRVELRPLSYYAFNEATYEVQMRIAAFAGSTEPRNVKLLELLDCICRNGFFLSSKADRQDVSELLLRQPLRTVIQVLFAASQTLATRWEPKTETHPSFDVQAESKEIEAFQDELPSIFLDNLLACNLEFDSINVHAKDALILSIVTFLTQNDRWQEGYRLKPEFQDDDFSLSALALGLRFAREVNRHPFMVLDYLVKVGLTREGLLALPTRTIDVSAARYIRFVGLDANDSALQVARKTLAVMRERTDGTLNPARLQTGTFSLRTKGAMRTDLVTLWPDGVMLGPDYKDPEDWPDGLNEFVENFSRGVRHKLEKATLGAHYNTLASLQRNVQSWHYLAVTLPAANVLDGRKSSYNYYSIFNLLGVIAEVMQAAAPEEVLLSAAQLRSFPTPNWTMASTGVDDREMDRVSSPPNTKRAPRHDLSGAFAAALHNWANHGRTGAWRNASAGRRTLPLATHVLAKIWTRFYYTLRQLDHDPPKEQLLGVLFHRSIIALLNAVLVEEDLHAAPLRRLGLPLMLLNNPVRSDANFLANLQRWEQSKETYPLFTYLFQCPLWSLYLAPEGKVYEQQLDSWEAFVVTGKKTATAEKMKVLQQEMLRVEYKTLDGTAEFKGLFTLLNTVPLTGTRWDRANAVEEEDEDDDEAGL